MEKDTLDGEEPLLVALSAELHWANGIVLSSSSSSSSPRRTTPFATLGNYRLRPKSNKSGTARLEGRQVGIKGV